MLWVSGPEPTSTHDLTFLCRGKNKQQDNWKRSSLYFHVLRTPKLVGDSTYAGQLDKSTTTMDVHAPEAKNLFVRMKSTQETCFKRLKDFKVLRNSFRHGKNTADKLETIKVSFDAAAMLVQYVIENGHPLFQV